MLVVSNTSPLNYLVLLDLVHLLESLFGRILVPEEVVDELRADGAPVPVRAWLQSTPDWIDIRSSGEIAADLLTLDPGERAAIALADAVGADLILLDEKKARDVARMHGLAIVGTLGVLDLAARRGLIDLREAVERLGKTNFRAAPSLLHRFLQGS